MAVVFTDGLLLGTLTVRVGRLSVISSRPFQSNSWRSQQASAVAAPIKPTIESGVKPTSEIPGPSTYPIIGSVFPWRVYKGLNGKNLHVFFENAVAEYGSILKMTTPVFPNMVIVSNPDDTEIVMRNTMDNPVRPPLGSLQKVRLEAIDNYFEKKTGLLNENGEEWKRVRSRVQTPMMKPKNVSLYLPEVDQVALEFMDRIAMLQKEHGEMPEDFQKELYKWALESVGLVALNRRIGCLEPNISNDSEPMKMIQLANQMMEALTKTELSQQSWRLFKTPSYKRLKKSHDGLVRVAGKYIRETEAALLTEKSDSEDKHTLMETLLLTPGLSRKDVITVMLDMFFAGIDTTSHTLGFVLYLLARNPNSQAKLQEEVDRVLGDHQGTITPKHLAQLSYLKAVIKESLRLFPITFGTSRILERDVVLSGYLVPKGFLVMMLHMGNRDERLFPRVDEFLPERWLRHKPLGPIHPYASLPFGTGTRMCIGRRIAEQELYTFLTRVMQRFSVDYKYEDMDRISRIVLMPSKPLQFSFTERR